MANPPLAGKTIRSVTASLGAVRTGGRRPAVTYGRSQRWCSISPRSRSLSVASRSSSSCSTCWSGS